MYVCVQFLDECLITRFINLKIKVLIYNTSFIYETEIVMNTSQDFCENQEDNRYKSTFKSIKHNLHIKNHNYYNMKIIWKYATYMPC